MLRCENCGAEFDRPTRSKRRTCSRSCAVSLSWKDPDTYARRSVSISEAVNTPKNRERITRENYKRWAKPGEREKLSKLSRERWSDGEFRAKTSESIRNVWTDEKRERFSGQLRSRRWDLQR